MFAKQWTFFQGDLPHYTFKQGKQGKRIPGLNYSFILMVCVQRNVQCYLNFVFCLMFTSFFLHQNCAEKTPHTTLHHSLHSLYPPSCLGSKHITNILYFWCISTVNLHWDKSTVDWKLVPSGLQHITIWQQEIKHLIWLLRFLLPPAGHMMNNMHCA